jgi:hypothetical protein
MIDNCSKIINRSFYEVDEEIFHEKIQQLRLCFETAIFTGKKDKTKNPLMRQLDE